MNRPWTSHYDHPVPEPFPFPETTLDRIFAGTVASHPDWVALSYNDEDTTYRQLDERVNRFAHGLRSLGVGKGDRVALMLPTSPVYPMAAVAVHKIGAVIVNVGVMTKGPEFAGILQATGARVLVTLDVFLPNIHLALAAAGVQHLILHSVSGIEQKLPPLAVPPLPLEQLLRTQPACEPRAVAEPGDLAVLQMTSGTSGRPKAVMLTHRNIVANLLPDRGLPPAHSAVQRRGDLPAAVLSRLRLHDLLPALGAAGLSHGAGPALRPARRGASARAAGEIPAGAVAARGARSLDRAHQAPRGRQPGTRALLADIEMPSCGGAPLPPTVKERYFQLTGRRLHEAYGLSEAASTTHMTPLTKPSPAGSIGIPLPGTDARIVDLEDSDRTLDPGEVGELAVSGPQIMGGYWQTPEATESTARLKDGWLFTGDLARMDAEGFFFIVDRRDDMIITSGFNVYPSEIEAVLKAHPGVADAVVVGVPDPSRGCSIVARVVPREGETLTGAQVLEHCRSRLPDYKVPRRVLIVAEIPKSPVGKPLRRELRKAED